MGGRGAVPVAVALAVGLVLGRAAGMHAACAALAAGVACGWLSRRAPARTATLLVLAAVALAATARSGAHVRQVEQARAALIGPETLARITARVSEPPSDAGEEPLAIVRLERSEPRLPHGARLRLRFPAGTRLEWSDRITGLVRLDRPEPARNPGGFDARRFAEASGLLASGRAVWCRRSAATGTAAWPRATFGRWRSAIERRLSADLSPSARALVVPLVLGDRSELPPALGSELRVAGLVHLIALSGLHVSWLAQLARTFAAAASAGAAGRAASGAACAVLYLGLAGPIPSLARAALTELMASAARAGSRVIDPLQALAASAVVLLLVRPEWIGDLGFQLSCTATLGLVTMGGARTESSLVGRTRAARSLVAAAGALRATVGAQLASLPLLLSSFHLLPWVAPAANLAAVPLAGLLLASSWIALVADLAAPGLGAPWFAAAETLCSGLRAVTAVAARVPGAASPVPEDPALVVIAALGATLLALAGSAREPPAAEPSRLTRCGTWPGLLGATLCGSALVLAATAPERRPPHGCAWLVALDVGQGDAIALGLDDGWWLVDAGPRTDRFDAGERVVVPFLRWAGVRSLQGLALTHSDADHCGGAAAVLDALPVRSVRVPSGAAFPPDLTRRLRAGAVASGDTLRSGLVVLWPPRDSGALAWASGVTADNATSLVLELGRGRALLLADVDSTVEARLPVEPPVAVLKVAHHGAASSSGGTFLARARPRIAIVSCGRRNRFGHPDPRALGRLEDARAHVLRTDEEGAVWCELDDAEARVVHWRALASRGAERLAGAVLPPGAHGPVGPVARP